MPSSDPPSRTDRSLRQRRGPWSPEQDDETDSDRASGRELSALPVSLLRKRHRPRGPPHDRPHRRFQEPARTGPMTNHRLRWAVCAAGLALASTARADTVQASSTTMLLGRQDFRLPAAGDASTTITAIPLYEILNLAASDLHTRYADFEVALSTWGSIDLGDKRFWQNGAQIDKRYTGDVNVGFIRADFLNHDVSLRLGRQLVADGVARMVQLDGVSAQALLPANFGLSGYAGSPVAAPSGGTPASSTWAPPSRWRPTTVTRLARTWASTSASSRTGWSSSPAPASGASTRAGWARPRWPPRSSR